MKFPKTKKKASGSIPFGYELTEDGKQLQAVPKQIKMLRDAVDGVITGKIASLREAKEIIENSSEDVTISHQTISKYVKKEKIELGLVDPNKPSRGYNYHSKTKAKIAAQKSIREEVIMPRYENGVISELNKEVEYHFSSSLSASLGLYYSSSFVLSDFDNKWEHGLGTDRLFYIGCIQDGRTTVSDKGNRYQDETPAVDITITSPTKLVTTDSPSTKLDVV